MSATEYTDQHMREVWSWVHNQDRCVTTQSVALGLGLPRRVAASLLQELPRFKNEQQGVEYEFTKYCRIQESPNKTVFKLVKSTGASTGDLQEDEMMYSIALINTESVDTAHERDMATFREKLETENDSVLNPELHGHDVTPREAVQRDDAKALRKERISGIKQTMSKRVASKPTVMRKTTTASDFFGKKKDQEKKTEKKPKAASSKTEKKAKQATGKTEKKPKTTTAAAKRPAPAEKKKKANTTTKKAAKKKPRMDIVLSDSDDDTVDFSQPSPNKKIRPEEEKENTVNKRVGNADDFVGDQDEDDEFVVMEEERKKRNAARLQQEEKQAKTAAAKQEATRQSQPEMGVAKDAQAPVERKRKRRKKLEGKTSMDANGYLHTETVTVWEDIPTDEEEVVEVRKPLEKPKVKKNMKQVGLMGFFKKK